MLYHELYTKDTTGIASDFIERLDQESKDGAWKLGQVVDAADKSRFVKFCLDVASQVIRKELFDSFEVDPGFASGGDQPWVPIAAEYFGNIEGIIEAVGFKILSDKAEVSESLLGKTKNTLGNIRGWVYRYTLGAILTRFIDVPWDVKNEDDFSTMMMYIFVAAILIDCVSQQMNNGIETGSHNPG